MSDGSLSSKLVINGDRLWDSLMELAQIGATPKGGVCRLALTDLDQQGRDLVVSLGEGGRHDASPSTRSATSSCAAPGSNPSLPPIVTGSHIDTQPTGGKFDGNYGVLAGIEVVRTLNDHGIETEAPIEVAFWTNEEGSRFVPGDDGLGRVRRRLHARARLRREGRRRQDGARTSSSASATSATQEPGKHPIGAYFEAHIEQGPVLEDADMTIGVVTGVLGLRWYDCVVTGMEAHAGPTPMALRKDALQVATRIMQEMVAIAHSLSAATAAARSAWCRCSRTAAT